MSEINKRLPITTEDLQRNSNGFYGLGSLRNAVLAVDGTLLPIQRPATEAGRGGVYFTRKHFHGLNFQTAVDPFGNIAFVSGGRPGTVWDGNVYQEQPFYKEYVKSLPSGFVILADSGYVSCPKTITPYKQPRNGTLTEQQRRFNTLHALSRNIVEKVIGRLKTRFRWMLRGIELSSPKEASDRFIVCCILHNMCNEHDTVAGEEIGLAEGDEVFDKRTAASHESEDERKKLEEAIDTYMDNVMKRLLTDANVAVVEDDLDDYIVVDEEARASDPSRLPHSVEAELARQALVKLALKDGHIKMDAAENALLNQARSEAKARAAGGKRKRNSTESAAAAAAASDTVGAAMDDEYSEGASAGGLLERTSKRRKR